MIPLRIQICRWMKSAALDGALQKMGQWTAAVDRYGSLIARLQPDVPTPEQVDTWLATIKD